MPWVVRRTRRRWPLWAAAFVATAGCVAFYAWVDWSLR
jgi:hypothetical protein